MQKKTIVLMLLLGSCTGPEKSNITSEWVDLKTAGKSSCQTWPMDEKDLETQTIQAIQGLGGFVGFASHIKLRNASFSHAFIPSDSSLKLNLEEALQLPIGHSSVLLAGWSVGSQSIVVTANNTGSRATLEARSVSDNRVVAKSAFVLDGNIRDANVAVDDDEMWLSLRTGDYSSVFARLKMKGETGQFEKVGLPSESRGAIVVVDRAKSQPYLVENLPTSDQLTLKVTALKGKEFAPGQAQQIQFEAKGGVESWSVLSATGGILVAAVTGDSMVGQGNLFIGRLENRGSSLHWAWHKTLALADIHVSEPVWAPTPNGGVLTLMKWLEGEATMGVYEVSQSSYTARGDRGVYPKGSIVLSAFSPDSNSLGVVLRQKKDDFWAHSICRSAL